LSFPNATAPGTSTTGYGSTISTDPIVVGGTPSEPVFIKTALRYNNGSDFAEGWIPIYKQLT